MKANRDIRSVMVALLLLGALVIGLVAIGCSGDDGETSTTGTTVVADAGTALTLAPGQTTTVADNIDPLSSFKSKDPFILQAQATTTSIPPATTGITSVTPTTAAVTTTAPHRLTVNAFPGGGVVSFTIDGDSFTGFGAGPALFNGAWGSIQILAVNDGVSPYTATFRRDGSVDFSLELNRSTTW